jgi:cellulose synthase operon protein C
MGPVNSPLLESLLSQAVESPDGVPDWLAAYRRAASVLASFDPRELRPYGHAPVPAAWLKLLRDSERAGIPSRPDRWRLRDSIRREALHHLKERDELSLALDANPKRDRSDALQIVLEQVVRGEHFNLLEMTREQLAGLGVVREWFDGILPVPDEAELRAAIPLSDVLAPMQKLATVFVGREKELIELEDFVGVREARSLWSVARRAGHGITAQFSQRTPLFVCGPGGIGKSTLIAKFVLEHVKPEDGLPLPFVYLDVDRATINPQRPATLLLEAAIQLSTQFPKIAAPLQETITQMRADLHRSDANQMDKALETPEAFFIPRLEKWARDLAKATPLPILFVVDTFEEVQFIGPAAVRTVWSLLLRLQSRLEMLRIVVAGRVVPDEVKTTALRLAEMDASGARMLLKRWLPEVKNDAIIDEIAAIAGGSPMALRLAAQVVNQQGIDKLREVETRNFLLLRVRSEKVQAQLYGRVLAHIHDPLVKKLAYPGLVVRRITPDIIREVLAGPCEIPLDTSQAAVDLFEALAREVALVENDGPGAVRHRPDVRRLMIADLLANVPPATVKAIDQGAAKYYVGQTGARARAEEIYHRLRLGERGGELDSRWMDGVGESLRTSLNELPAPGRLWLSRKLGVTPPPGVLAQADLQDWEAIVASDAQRYLQSGAAAEAIKLFASRKDRSPDSPLFRLEAEAYRLMGADKNARDCAIRGITAASAAGYNELALDLHLFIAAIDEGQEKLEAALSRLDAAQALTALPLSPFSVLRLNVTRIRIRRLLGSSYDKERAELCSTTNEMLTPALLRELGGQPALLRELVAELGEHNPELLRHGLEVLGIERPDSDHARRLRELLPAAEKTSTLTQQILQSIPVVLTLVPLLMEVFRSNVAASVERVAAPKKSKPKPAKKSRQAEPSTPVRAGERNFRNIPPGSQLLLKVDEPGAVIAHAYVLDPDRATHVMGPLEPGGTFSFSRRGKYTVDVTLTFLVKSSVHIEARIVAPGSEQHEIQKLVFDGKGNKGDLEKISIVIDVISNEPA